MKGLVLVQKMPSQSKTIKLVKIKGNMKFIQVRKIKRILKIKSILVIKTLK